MPKNYVADSSAVVAFLSRDDEHHHWMALQLGGFSQPLLTCEPALTEMFHLVGSRGRAQLDELLKRGLLKLAFNLETQLEPVLHLMEKYSDVPMSLADGCLVRMTEVLADPVIITTDSDFKIYRRHSRQVVPCLMP